MSNMSPWEIGAAFYDQRDLYTRNARVDRGGYGEGPDLHPPEGSYAYLRGPEPSAERGPEPTVGGEPSVTAKELLDVYEREAWPWQNYDVGRDLHAKAGRAKARRSPWQRVKRLLRGRS